MVSQFNTVAFADNIRIHFVEVFTTFLLLQGPLAIIPGGIKVIRHHGIVKSVRVIARIQCSLRSTSMKTEIGRSLISRNFAFMRCLS